VLDATLFHFNAIRALNVAAPRARLRQVGEDCHRILEQTGSPVVVFVSPGRE